MALWDIAGKAMGAPVYKLLGGKIRDQVRVYNGAVRFPMEGGRSPADYADNMQRMIDAPQKFSIIKQASPSTAEGSLNHPNISTALTKPARSTPIAAP